MLNWFFFAFVFWKNTLHGWIEANSLAEGWSNILPMYVRILSMTMNSFVADWNPAALIRQIKSFSMTIKITNNQTCNVHIINDIYEECFLLKKKTKKFNVSYKRWHWNHRILKSLFLLFLLLFFIVYCCLFVYLSKKNE